MSASLPSSSESALLEVRELNSYYGPIQALRDVSVDVGEGEVVAILGPNGAGKSTLLHSISGLVRPRTGTITYRKKDITYAGSDKIVRLGIIQVPEGRRIFTQMTVMENLLIGAYARRDKGLVDQDLDFVMTLFPDLAEKKTQLGGELSGGQQQMLAIARGLMAKPSLLLLDEPSLGLSPIMVEHVATTVATIRKEVGTSILLVEQNAGLALELASRVFVMQTGRVIMSGPAEAISPTEIRAAYLGEAAPEYAQMIAGPKGS
jgi:branched-chain amino acid transport system ATP-binding protein